jgi:hypothetical protein
MKPIIGYEDRYVIYQDGRITFLPTNKGVQHTPYPITKEAHVGLFRDDAMTPYRIADLVATHYVANPNLHRKVAFADGNTHNLRATNLLWEPSGIEGLQTPVLSPEQEEVFNFDLYLQAFLGGLSLNAIAAATGMTPSKCTDHLVLKAAEFHYGSQVQTELARQRSSTHRINNKGKRQAVQQFKKDGTFVAEYVSLTQAAQAVDAKNVSAISQALNPRSRLQSAYGFIWKYA